MAFVRHQRITLAPGSRGQRAPPYLHGFHDVQVGHVLVDELGVLRHVDVLLGHHHSLLKKEFVDGNSVLLGHQHLKKSKWHAINIGDLKLTQAGVYQK